MAESLLHVRAELAESAVVLDDFEERVVTKAIRAGRLEANSATADVAGSRPESRRSDRRPSHGTRSGPFAFPAACCQAFRAGNDCSLRPWRSGPAKPGRVHARGTAQRIDRQATVVGEHPAAQMHGLLRSLQPRIGRERIAIFDDFDASGSRRA